MMQPIPVLLLSVAAAAIPGCATVDVGPDLDATSKLIAKHTGSSGTHRPDFDEQAGQVAIEAMLGDGLTVEEAVAVAMLQNPTLRSQLATIGISRAALVAATLPRNPVVSVSARFPSAGAGVVDFAAQIMQSVVDLFALPARRRQQERQLAAVRVGVAQGAVVLAGNVRRACYRTLVRQRGVVVADDTWILASQIVGLTKRRLAAGTGDAIAVNLAQSAALAAQRLQLRAQRDLQIEQAELDRLLGCSLSRDSFVLTDTLPDMADIASYEQLLDHALAERLDLRVAEWTVAAAAAGVDVQEINRVPRTTIGAQFERPESPPTLTGPALQTSLPLFSRNEPGVAQAQFRLASARHQLEAVRNSLTRDVRLALAKVEANADVLRSFENQALPLAEQNVSASQRAFAAGERTIPVLLAAQQALLAMRVDYTTALLEYATARADLEQAVGGRLPRANQAESGK